MRTAEQIYEQYRIMPGLQMHQLRVAAVIKLLADSLEAPVDLRAVILTGLFHDMGNILKSDLVSFPDFLGDKSVGYWQGVKAEYAGKYGTNVHAATLAIGREIGLDEKIIALMDGMGFSRMELTRDSDSMEKKIVEYADSRVAPRGVLPLRERLEDARRRYGGSFDQGAEPAPSEKWLALANAASEIERQIFAHSSLKPEDMHDASIATMVEELKRYQVSA